MKHSISLILVAAVGSVACGSDKTTPSKSHSSSHAVEDDGGSGDSWGTDGGSGKKGLALDECGLSTGYAGDDQCILPPPPDKGFQLHVGPDDYDNPDALYTLAPGEEKTDDIPGISNNDSDVFFFYRQYRVRPSTHHIIITAANGSDVIAGRRIGTANLSEDYPTGGVIASEDQGVGLPLAAHANVNSNFHAINTTDQPALREAWINFWYRDAADVTQPAQEWFETGDITFNIPPHTSQTLGPYTCNVDNDGRLLWMYGHRHANNTRFTATRIRGDARDVIYDADKWDEPLMLEYSSLVTNPAADIPAREGGWSGILDLSPGDKVEWKCEVTNDHDTALRFTNQTLLGEMCIVDAEAVGSNCF